MDLCGSCYAVAIIAIILLWLIEKKLGLIFQFFHKAEPHVTLHGGTLVADVLESHGVKFIFTLVGGHISPILVASEKKGIRIIDTRHEATAVFAADAVARLSGTIGVAAVTAGPGVTNTVTAVKNAQMAESPVLVIGGAAATLLKGRGALQDIDQLSLFRPLCKYATTVTKVREIVPTLRKAIQIAQSGTPGPVFVEFPIDTLYPYAIVLKEVGVKDMGGSTSWRQSFVNWYLKNHVNNLFAGGWEQTSLTPLPVNIPKALQPQVARCVDLLLKAKKPVIVLGSQATLPPVPVEKLRKCLEDLGIPCFLGGMSRGLLGHKSPLQVRQKRGEALKEADLILLAGAVCDFRLGYGRSLNKKAKIISVNRDSIQLYKNADMFWRPAEAVLGDVASFLLDLQSRLGAYKCDESWLRSLKAKDEKIELANLSKCDEEMPKHLNTVKVLHELEEVMSDNTIMVADGGDFVGTAAYIVRPRGPLTWLDPGAFGTLGVGGGFALGAKLCRPESDVWCIYGDGAVGYSVVEFDTYSRHKTPIIAIVGNDAAWSQILREQVPMFGSDVACSLQYTEYDAVARGFDGKGYKLDKTDSPRLKEVLSQAQEDARKGASVLINVLIDKSDFREGSISV